MYDPESLDALFNQLDSKFKAALAEQRFGETTTYAKALEQFNAWRAAGAQGDLPAAVTSAPGVDWQAIVRLTPQPAANRDGRAAINEPSADLQRTLAALRSEMVSVQSTLATLQQSVGGVAAEQRTWLRTWTPLAILAFVLGLGLLIWLWWQGMVVLTTRLDALPPQIDDVGVLVSNVLGGLATPVNALPGQIEQLATSVAVNNAAITNTNNAPPASNGELNTRLDGLTNQIAQLPERISALEGQVSAVGTAVATLGEPAAAANPGVNLTPTPDATQTAQTIAALIAAERAPLAATANALSTQAADLSATQTALATGVADAATSQALAATAQRGTAQAASATAQVIIATVQSAAALQSAETGGTPAPTSIPLLTPTPATVSITFPAAGAQLFVAPWEIVVRGDPWLTDTTRYRLRLNEAVLVEFDRPADGATFAYTRAISGDFDDFPGLSAEARTALALDENNQLLPGDYAITLEALGSAPPTALNSLSFTIRGDEPLVARVNPSDGVRRRPVPSDSTSVSLQPSLRQDIVVRILGKAIAPYQNVSEPWCFSETQDEQVRRGWTPCRFLMVTTGNFANQTADQVADQIPDLAPPQ